MAFRDSFTATVTMVFAQLVFQFLWLLYMYGLECSSKDKQPLYSDLLVSIWARSYLFYPICYDPLPMHALCCSNWRTLGWLWRVPCRAGCCAPLLSSITLQTMSLILQVLSAFPASALKSATFHCRPDFHTVLMVGFLTLLIILEN